MNQLQKIQIKILGHKVKDITENEFRLEERNRQKVEYIDQLCMRCGKLFKSESKFLRQCFNCKRYNATIDSSMCL